MQKTILKRAYAISILALFVEISLISIFNENLSICSIAKSPNNWLNIGGSEYSNHNEIQTKKNLTYGAFKEVTYIEQSPPSPSEWDGIYEKYTLISQEADIHYDRESQDGSTNLSNNGMKYKLKDRYFDSYYETHYTFNITKSPCFFWFDFPKVTNISFMRFYFYNPSSSSPAL